MDDDLAVVWFRRDLRLADNPAWAEATAAHDAVLALYVLDRTLLDRAGAHRRRRILHDLAALDRSLAERGGGLRVVEGDAGDVVAAEAAELGATDVYANADVTPYALRRDAAADASHARRGLELHWSWGGLVHAPGTVRTRAGQLSKVFTPFHRAWQARAWDPWPEPGEAEVRHRPALGLPAPDGPYPLIGGEEGATARPGEDGAAARLQAFLDRVERYAELHDRPGDEGTTQLSPDLRMGTLAARTVVEAVGEGSAARAAVVRQLAWRDWFAHTLALRPQMVDEPIDARFAAMRWRRDDAALAAWQEGLTGVPLVDAGMRQLRTTGWMHNRVRMVVASFLVKNLLVDWRRGERWYRHLLMDGDVPQNVGNWQWVAGTGLDAAPFDRVFNPVLQGRRFDPQGVYVRRWVPEIAALSDADLHEPWAAGPLELAAAGVVLGETYPEPIVDLKASRGRALDAYDEARRGEASPA
jgi:deoxyribodipyrimidine photo-lyase